MRSRIAKKLVTTTVVGFLFILFIVNSQSSNHAQTEEKSFKRLNDEMKSDVVYENVETEDPLQIEKEMKNRLSQMSTACHKFGLGKAGNDSLHKPYPWEFFINKNYHLVWCNVFKSGSSSWLYVFNRLAGISDKALSKQHRRTPPVTLARHYYPRPTVPQLLEAIKHSITFIVGRHPLERLVSGYRDKILLALRGSYHEKVGRAIILKYRGVDVKRLGRIGLKMRPTFSEFVRYILDDHAAGIDLDMHWTPVYSFCNPCQVNFSHIVKFETFRRDQEFILKQAKVNHLVSPHRENAAKDGKKSSQLVDKFLSELDSELLEKLVQLYLPDFEIFGYETPK